MIGDMMKKAAGLAGSAGNIKEDVVLLKDEAVAIMKEIEELQKIAASLMQRQKKVMDAIGRIKNVADGGGGGKSLMDVTK
jgi:prefoldin subunit 5